ncbi:putative transcriptional regulatory protein-like protein [Lipomyces starkeyi]
MLTNFAARSSGPPTRESSPLIKRSRQQVSRACEWCRVRRIRCENNRPCRNCRVRGDQCSNNRSDEVRTLPQALKEIERLRFRVEELDAQLEARAGRSILTPSESSLSIATPSESVTSPSSLENGAVKVPWQGIYVASARSEQTSYYGPSSTFYFISRIGAYLGTVLQQPIVDQSMQPRGANKSLVSPTSSEDAQDTEIAPTGNTARAYLSRSQEEYFLSLFWESYHCILPIIDEGEFRRQYAALWDASRPQRKASPLVDIILALSMQYGFAFLPRDTSTISKQDGHYEDATIAGRWYYRRCQSLLALELESPSITTLQCHIYSSVYLCCASFQNMAHTTISLAVRTAQILGLHLEPPADMPRSERELRKRIWWVLYTIEMKTCMKLGRPFSAQDSQSAVTPPSDDPEAASLLGGILGSYGTGITWLTYAVQCQKLVATTCTIYRSLYDKFASVLCQKNIKSPYKNPQGLEICAEFLSSRTSLLQEWLAQVPSGMKTSRRSSGSPFSTDRTALNVETTAPIWLQRQRIFLELMYHTMCMNLYRPFITFSPSSGTYTPVAEKHAAACINHAIAHTQIMHQVLNESDLLNGWQESFQWQWNASVTTIGFVLAYPVGPSTPAARKSLDKAVEVFEIFGGNFAVAESAAGVTKDLAAKADTSINRFRMGVMRGAGIGDDSGVQSNQEAAGLDMGFGQMGEAVHGMDGSGYYSEFMDGALTVDAFNSFEEFYADICNPADLWAFTQQ